MITNDELEFMEKELDELRFDKCRVERPQKTTDPLTGITNQETRIVIGEYKVKLDENTSSQTMNTQQKEVSNDKVFTYSILCKNDVDIETGDYLFIKKNFYLGRDMKEQEFRAGDPKKRLTHQEIPCLVKEVV